MKPDATTALREHVLYLLRGGGAHLDFEKAIAGLPPASAARSRRASRTRPGACWSTCGWRSGTFWSSRATRPTSRPRSPRATGPTATPRPTTAPGTAAWPPSGPTCKAMQDLVADPATDLFAPIPARRGPDGAARGAAGGRPQRLPPRAAGPAPPSPRCLARRWLRRGFRTVERRILSLFIEFVMIEGSGGFGQRGAIWPNPPPARKLASQGVSCLEVARLGGLAK